MMPQNMTTYPSTRRLPRRGHLLKAVVASVLLAAIPPTAKASWWCDMSCTLSGSLAEDACKAANVLGVVSCATGCGALGPAAPACVFVCALLGTAGDITCSYFGNAVQDACQETLCC